MLDRDDMDIHEIWWLRTPGSKDGYVDAVRNGIVEEKFFNEECSIRPALLIPDPDILEGRKYFSFRNAAWTLCPFIEDGYSVVICMRVFSRDILTEAGGYWPTMVPFRKGVEVSDWKKGLISSADGSRIDKRDLNSYDSSTVKTLVDKWFEGCIKGEIPRW